MSRPEPVVRVLSGLRGLYRASQQERFLRWRKGLALLFACAVAAFLVWRLGQIGWGDIWRARPASPGFYLLLVLSYFALPVADALIYRQLWGIRFWQDLPVFLRKRIYNAALVGYSGELYLLAWARKRVAQDDLAIIHMIKDTNILSAAVSTYVSAGVIAWVLTRIDLSRIAAGPFLYWAAATFVIAALIPFSLLFQRRFMLIGGMTAAAVFAIHLARFLLNQLLQLGQWHLEMPGVTGTVLASLLAVQLIVGRIPFLPSRDLLFVTIGIGLSSSLSLPQATIASLLVTTSALQQFLHLVVFAATSLGPRPLVREVAI